MCTKYYDNVCVCVCAGEEKRNQQRNVALYASCQPIVLVTPLRSLWKHLNIEHEISNTFPKLSFYTFFFLLFSFFIFGSLFCILIILETFENDAEVILGRYVKSSFQPISGMHYRLIQLTLKPTLTLNLRQNRSDSFMQ